MRESWRFTRIQLIYLSAVAVHARRLPTGASTPDDSLTTTTFEESVMADSHYSADSAPLPLPRLLCLVRSEVIGTSRTLMGDCGTAKAARAFPATPSSIG
jgi:hypothetical protein